MWGVIIIGAGMYPILFLNVSASLANLDPAMEQAAANLGASRWTIFRKITLPLMRPGLFAGGTIVLVWRLTELGTPLMFDMYDVTPVQISTPSTRSPAARCLCTGHRDADDERAVVCDG